MQMLKTGTHQKIVWLYNLLKDIRLCCLLFIQLSILVTGTNDTQTCSWQVAKPVRSWRGKKFRMVWVKLQRQNPNLLGLLIIKLLVWTRMTFLLKSCSNFVTGVMILSPFHTFWRISVCRICQLPTMLRRGSSDTDQCHWGCFTLSFEDLHLINFVVVCGFLKLVFYIFSHSIHAI